MCFWESDADATERGIDRRRRCVGAAGASGSSESDGECFGVDAAEETMANGLRVRRMGEAESSVAGEVAAGIEGEGEADADGEGETFRGRVRAQFSQGMARLRSASS